ncbi:amino acid kinase [Methanocella conradii]|uniref:amino acid kinase n=1 Tax=Methanocella conradii TaxID=1175444 RepID=UPI0020C6DC59|nr:amino acid kinase [Methanocella conradii]
MGIDVLVVPGGGPFADMVRDVDERKGLSNDAAHWMAVLAMDQYAYYLSDKAGIELTPLLVKKRGVRILLPYEVLKRQDELPHSWDVTSDTIAAWAALKTASPLIKATDVDGIMLDGRLQETVNASEIKGVETCVDRALPGFLIKHGMDALIVNGLIPGRLENALRGNQVVGTKIIGR